MNERTRTTRESQSGPPGLGGIFDGDDNDDALVTVASGPYAERLPVSNTTVGQIRARFRDRFDIDPRSQAVVDGRDAGDETVVRAGQVLMFTHRAGEKGNQMVTPQRQSPEKVHIDGTEVHAVSPEGQKASMPLPALFKKVAPERMDSCGVVLPDGVKALLASGPFAVWVHQSPPRTYAFKWIAKDSPARFGPGTEYRNVRLALPYLIVLAVFGPNPKGQMTLLGSSECFFRVNPLESLEDELCYPALLNCSKFSPQEGRPLSWICSQHLKRASFDAEPDQNRRLRAGFQALMHCLLETGFNYSSEHHEASSWFTESCGVDPRVATVESWEAASQEDRLFALEVPWLKTGFSVQHVVQRIFKNLGAAKSQSISSGTLARLIFNHVKAS